jgi:trehalose synthase
MSALTEVRVGVQPLERFREILGRSQMRHALAVARETRDRLSRRVLWNVNSTAVGGGVAEMLRSLLGYTRSVGIDSRWLVIQGNPEFFRITKRLHHALHGSPGDRSPLDDAARAVYEETLRANAVEMAAVLRERDIVLLHDPQTAGLVPHMLRSKTEVIWRCHIGHDHPTEEVERGWHFLEPYLEDVPALVFSRESYVPGFCDRARTTIIQPSIDAFSAKNQELDEESVRIILTHTGLVGGRRPWSCRYRAGMP